MWQQIEDNVDREIRGAIAQYSQTAHICKLAAYGVKQREYAERFERIKNTATPSEKESFIRAVAYHLESVEMDMGNFDFAANADHLVFNWAFLDAYLGAITHEKMVLLMLRDLCKWLDSTSPINIFRESHWTRKLRRKEREWKTYALKTGPEAAKKLYWGRHSFKCTWFKARKTIECTDALKRPVRFRFDNLHDNQVGRNTYRGPRYFYRNIAINVWSRFTSPILTLVGEPDTNGKRKTTGASGSPCYGGSCKRGSGTIGPSCRTARGREECFDTEISSLPKTMFDDGCLLPCITSGWSVPYCAIKHPLDISKERNYRGRTENCRKY